jgi:hypothetical protein
MKTETSIRGRKASRSAVITSSPYKRQLVASFNNKIKKGSCTINGKKETAFSGDGAKKKKYIYIYNRASKAKVVKRKCSQEDTEESDSDEWPFLLTDDSESDVDLPVGHYSPGSSDAQCLFCEGKFSDDHYGELWAQCIM